MYAMYLDSFCLGGPNVGVCFFKLVRGLPQFAPCLEHICAGGGGGDVTIEVFTCIGV